MKPRITRMNTDIKKTAATSLYGRIREILESAKTTAARSVNTTQVVANWLVGREIVEEEQNGHYRADYGKRLVATLSMQITREFGPGYSVQNLFYFKQFYLTYSNLLSPNLILHATRGESPRERPSKKLHALRGEFESACKQPVDRYCGPIVDAVRQLFGAPEISNAVRADSGASIGYAVRSQSWTPGQLHPNLSWTHYRTLLRVDKPEARSFYEIEAIQNNWSARAMERQICSLLYERLALSRDKKGLMRLATKGHEIQKPADVFKDPVVMEFLGLPESPKLVETDLEIRREVRLLRTPSASPRLRVRQSEVSP